MAHIATLGIYKGKGQHNAMSRAKAGMKCGKV
jgi:hypothetical protein